MVQVVQTVTIQTVCNVNHIMVVRGKKSCMRPIRTDRSIENTLLKKTVL